MKRVCDYDLVFGNGVFNCCADDIMNDKRPAKEGMQIECHECGAEMILSKGKDGVLKWRAI